MTIKILITGGTIDKTYNMNNGELYFTESHIPDILKQARYNAPYEMEQLMLKDSLEMSESDRVKILDACQQTECTRIMITHGTDTMVDTARFLSKSLEDKTIVLTGAMIPYVFKTSDALFNLGSALSATQVLYPGIYIAMNGQAFKADNVVKNRQLGMFEALKL